MISSYTNTTQTIAADGVLTFDNTNVLTGCTVKHSDGTPTFTLTKPGYYYVTFNAITTGTTTGTVTAQLLNGTNVVPGAVASTTITTVGDIRPLAFATIVRVLPSCCAIDNSTTLTISNTDVEATYSNANINITKLS